MAFEDFRAAAYENSFFIWQWINTEEWFRTFIDRNAVANPSPLCPELAAAASQGDLATASGLA